jgi:hypothetical protein
LLKTFDAAGARLARTAPTLVHFSHRGVAGIPTGTDSSSADLCTWNPRPTLRNWLKNKGKKVEERAIKTGHFHLTKMRFRFMIVSVPGFTERLAKQGEDGFQASIRSENRKSARRGAKDNRASGEVSLL